MLHHLSDGEGFFLSLWIFLWKSCKNLKHAANQRNNRCKLNTENKAVLVNPPWSFSPGPWLTSDLQQARVVTSERAGGIQSDTQQLWDPPIR